MKFEATRRPGWDIKLNEYIAKSIGRKFRMGKFDCCIFAAGAVKAMTGADPMKEFRKQYSSVATSKEALADIGKGTLYATLRSKFGNPINASKAFRGDVAYMDGNLGIVTGRKVLFLTSNEGFIEYQLKYVDKAFRVPF